MARVVINSVVRCQWHVDGASGLARRNHDDRAIGQGDGQVAQRRLAQVRGVDQYTAGLGDGRRRAQAQRRGERSIDLGGVVGVQVVNSFQRGQRHSAEASGWKTNGRVDPASGCIEHYKAVTTARCAAIACGCWARCSGFQVFGRVGAGNDGLLQLFNRWCGLCGGFGQVGAGVRRAAAPLRLATQVQGAAVGQLQRDRAGQAGVYLVADEQAIAFNKHAPDALWGHHENLTNNAFDDGNNTAH